MSNRVHRIVSVSVVLALALALAAAPAMAAEKASKTPTPKVAQAVEKVDINNASAKELEGLPGVGEATAQKIIKGRPYASVADLSKAGVSKSTIDKITPLVIAGAAKGTATTTKAGTETAGAKGAKTQETAETAAKGGALIDLNTASEKDLEALPGVGKATAGKIIAGRPYGSVDDLAKAGVGAKTLEKLRPLVTVGAAGGAAAAATTGKATGAKAGTGTVGSAPAQVPPVKGMVWVNTSTGVYHYEGDRWYGNTKQGKFMTEADAIKAGYRAAKTGGEKT